jgi:hypothetical protein
MRLFLFGVGPKAMHGPSTIQRADGELSLVGFISEIIDSENTFIIILHNYKLKLFI